MMDTEEVAQRIPHEPVGTHLLASRGACWQKFEPGTWKRTEVETSLNFYDDVLSDEELANRVRSSKRVFEFDLAVHWTLY